MEPDPLAKTVPNQNRAQDKAAKEQLAELAASQPAAARPSAPSAPSAPPAPAATADDARKAAAVQARAAGIVGALAQSHAAMLGDVYGDRRRHRFRLDFNRRRRCLLVGGQQRERRGDRCGERHGDQRRGERHGDRRHGDRRGQGGAGSGSEFGTLSGDGIGEAYGEGGLGLAGTGEGGGGSGFGTIGIGDIGTVGHGYGTGTGYGYGGGVGGLAGHHASVPVCHFGLAEVRGSCDKDLIRRVVRAHVNELRFCYERELQSHPALAGRVDASFVISFSGLVSSSSATGLRTVDSCVAASIARWQFVGRCVGQVHYPFTFEPGPDAEPLQCPDCRFARAATAEVAAGEEDRCTAEAVVVEYEGGSSVPSGRYRSGANADIARSPRPLCVGASTSVSTSGRSSGAAAPRTIVNGAGIRRSARRR